MTEDLHTGAFVEPERYEFREASSYHFELQRRDFFKALGAGILVVCALRDASGAQESGAAGPQFRESLPKEISAWLHLGEEGVVTVYTGKVEMGQNIRTSLAQGVAEELRVALDRIRLVMGDTQLTPFDIGTFGSRTTPTMNLQLRKASAAAREILVDLAVQRWSADRKSLAASGGRITDTETKRTIEYAALIQGRQFTQTIPSEDPLAAPTEWTVEGQSALKVGGRDFVTGSHRYPSDQKLPGMLYGKILRAPSFGATLSSAEIPPAHTLDGVTLVRDGDFIGAVAASEDLALSALAAARATWKEQPQPSLQELFAYLKNNLVEGRGPEAGFHFQAGSVDEALASADHRLQQSYTVSYIAHVPLEPRAAVAQWSGDSLTVWTGTQRPFAVRAELAQAFHISDNQVRVLVPDTGSAYGGKHTGECADEAERLARAAGKPVKVVWTREEEFTWAYFRPAGVIDIRGAARSDGTIAAWEFTNYNSGAAGIRTFYDIPHQRITFAPTKYPLRQGSYRGLAATANHFARESFMDELAHKVKMEPLEFRLHNLKDERLAAAFKAAADRFGWGRTAKEPGHGFGMGGGFEKGGNVATCVEVAANRSTGDVRILRVVTAFECGAIVNPDHLRNQVVGANIMGLGGALFEAIEFENGRILNPRFSQYRVPRFSDVPPIEAVLIDRKDVPSAGAGETPLMGLAPAIGNAIFDATGVRLRSLPMVPHGLRET